jgi:hypothetical protein
MVPVNTHILSLNQVRSCPNLEVKGAAVHVHMVFFYPHAMSLWIELAYSFELRDAQAVGLVIGLGRETSIISQVLV